LTSLKNQIARTMTVRPNRQPEHSLNHTSDRTAIGALESVIALVVIFVILIVVVAPMMDGLTESMEKQARREGNWHLVELEDALQSLRKAAQGREGFALNGAINRAAASTDKSPEDIRRKLTDDAIKEWKDGAGGNPGRRIELQRLLIILGTTDNAALDAIWGSFVSQSPRTRGDLLRLMNVNVLTSGLDQPDQNVRQQAAVMIAKRLFGASSGMQKTMPQLCEKLPGLLVDAITNTDTTLQFPGMAVHIRKNGRDKTRMFYDTVSISELAVRGLEHVGSCIEQSALEKLQALVHSPTPSVREAAWKAWKSSAPDSAAEWLVDNVHSADDDLAAFAEKCLADELSSDGEAQWEELYELALLSDDPELQKVGARQLGLKIAAEFSKSLDGDRVRQLGLHPSPTVQLEFWKAIAEHGTTSISHYAQLELRVIVREAYPQVDQRVHPYLLESLDLIVGSDEVVAPRRAREIKDYEAAFETQSAREWLPFLLEQLKNEPATIAFAGKPAAIRVRRLIEDSAPRPLESLDADERELVRNHVASLLMETRDLRDFFEQLETIESNAASDARRLISKLRRIADPLECWSLAIEIRDLQELPLWLQTSPPPSRKFMEQLWKTLPVGTTASGHWEFREQRGRVAFRISSRSDETGDVLLELFDPAKPYGTKAFRGRIQRVGTIVQSPQGPALVLKGDPQTGLKIRPPKRPVTAGLLREGDKRVIEFALSENGLQATDSIGVQYEFAFDQTSERGLD